jgi:peptidylprolyl isomerase
MQRVEDGMYVSVDYTGKLDDGETFDSSNGRRPLEFQVGSGQLISGFEKAVMGMGLHDKKVFTLSADEAYGERDEQQMHRFPRSEVPEEMRPEIGDCITLTTPEGQHVQATVAAIDEENLTFDLNHPLAGKNLTFEIEVVGISATPTQEASCGSGCDCSSGCEC